MEKIFVYGLIVIFMSCDNNPNIFTSAESFQKTANRLEYILKGVPELNFENNVDATRRDIIEGTRDLARKPSNAFNIINLLNVFGHIKLKDGYTIDYVIYDGGLRSGSRIYVYSRKINDKPFNNILEYDLKLRSLLNIHDKFIHKDQLEHPYRYENAILLDGTQESYFEYLLLSLALNQIYHSPSYEDERVICTKEKLNEVFFKNHLIPDSLKRIHFYKSLAPEIVFNDNYATLTINHFTNWGGLLKKKYSITKLHPHIIKDLTDRFNGVEKTDTLIKYDCGIRY